jgi:hypothetical protein
LEKKMAQANHPEPELVDEIVEHLLVKYEDLPLEQRKYVVSASIEAVALIAASESAVHCQKTGKDMSEAMQRAAACEKLFASEIEQDLIHCSFDP